MDKKLIYFPAFSSIIGDLKKNEELLPGLTKRFYSDEYPEKFRHPYFLLTAGTEHKKPTLVDDTGLRNCTVLGDSGGFQIASGVIKYTDEIREKIFHWLENNSHLAMNLDFPPKIKLEGKFDYCLEESYKNFKFFHEKQSGKTQFLNILQPGLHEEGYGVWYNKMKGFEFNGWAVAGAAKIFYNSIYGLAVLLQNREFEKKNNKWLHFLGATAIPNLFIYSAVQMNMNKLYPHVQVTTDSSSPLQFPVYGDYVYGVDYKDLKFDLIHFLRNPKKEIAYIHRHNTHLHDLACPINCPICSQIKLQELGPKTNVKFFTLYVGLHNLHMFTHVIKQIESLVGLHPHALASVLDKNFAIIVESIHEMFEKPENAILIFKKYKAKYEKFSNQLKVSHNNALMEALLEGIDLEEEKVEEKLSKLFIEE